MVLPPLKDASDGDRLLTDLALERGKEREGKRRGVINDGNVEGVQPVPRRVVWKVDSNEFSDLIQDQFPQDELNIPSSHRNFSLLIIKRNIE